MAESPTRQWQGLHGGRVDHLYVGAHVVDQVHGIRGQITALLEDDWVELRYDDDQVRRVHLRPAEPQAA